MKSCDIDNCVMPVFRTDKLTGKRYCNNHWYRFSTDIDKRSSLEKHMEKMKKQNQKSNTKTKVRSLINTPENKLVANQAAADIDALEIFFDVAAKILATDPRCVECGSFIPAKYYRAATAHILPKAIFKSVQTHPLNKLFLGAGCGCHNKTHRLDTFSEMGIFKEAVDRFRQFQHLIKEKHALLDEFIMYANKKCPL